MKTVQTLESEAKAFNLKYSIGEMVMLDKTSISPPIAVHLKTPAQLLGNHSVVVWLEEFGACYSIDKISKYHPTEIIHTICPNPNCGCVWDEKEKASLSCKSCMYPDNAQYPIDRPHEFDNDYFDFGFSDVLGC